MVSYKHVGVSIDGAKSTVNRIKALAKSTFNERVVGGIGSFGGAFDASFLKDYKRPVLVSTIDGVGTKVKLAAMTGVWHSVGQDIVNHSSNDILALGAKPLFFLDYLASSKLDQKIIGEIVRGMSIACKKLDCPLIGGETAQMPGVYAKGETDIAGCMVGVVERDSLIDGSQIREGNAILGLASDGLHTNGYTLARHVLLRNKDKGIAKELLRVHRSYSSAVLELMRVVKVNGIVHVTGGGLLGNTPRILPQGIGASINRGSWKVPRIFSLIQEKGKVGVHEMFRVFNMGIGLALFVPQEDASAAMDFLAKRKEKAFLIGHAIKEKDSKVLFYG